MNVQTRIYAHQCLFVLAFFFFGVSGGWWVGSAQRGYMLSSAGVIGATSRQLLSVIPLKAKSLQVPTVAKARLTQSVQIVNVWLL